MLPESNYTLFPGTMVRTLVNVLNDTISTERVQHGLHICHKFWGMFLQPGYHELRLIKRFWKKRVAHKTILDITPRVYCKFSSFDEVTYTIHSWPYSRALCHLTHSIGSRRIALYEKGVRRWTFGQAIRTRLEPEEVTI